MLPQLNYENLSPTHHYVIDVRSPGEYKEFHLPNGYHLPLFTDEERSYIGTIYKQENPERAKERGLAIYAGKLEGLYGDWKKLKAENKGKKAVVVCARGGNEECFLCINDEYSRDRSLSTNRRHP